ncbi:MAG: hypothetical protein LGR52_04450, partial [Candidatus Thiosymbion ectosymbiont of Robbea hypermnestra]|nr:hypothetical protein [Candidatus Thiosymbion ectosymbiont of Robbea hypermnestra]
MHIPKDNKVTAPPLTGRAILRGSCGLPIVQDEQDLQDSQDFLRWVIYGPRTANIREFKALETV